MDVPKIEVFTATTNKKTSDNESNTAKQTETTTVGVPTIPAQSLTSTTNLQQRDHKLNPKPFHPSEAATEQLCTSHKISLQGEDNSFLIDATTSFEEIDHINNELSWPDEGKDFGCSHIHLILSHVYQEVQ